MILHECEQGSSKWLRLRCGLPTASEFHRIVTPGGKISQAQEHYRNELLAEFMLGRPTDGVSMPWMDRGKELEAEAVEFYEFTNDTTTERVGFITNDAKTYGASPDRLVGEKGLLEIKVPKPSTHIEYLLYKGVDERYRPQLQGQLLVTGRDWVEILSYHPEMPPALVHVERDEKYIKLLSEELDKFTEMLEKLKAAFIEQGYLKNQPEPPEFISDADLDAILAARK